MNIEDIRVHSGKIAIVGHGCADFDAMTSGYLLEYVLKQLGIEAQYVLADGIEDEFFPDKAVEVGFHYQTVPAIPEDAVLFLVDHTAAYPNEVIACFDHHPTIVDIPHNYVNKPQTCCAKIIYDWAMDLSVQVPESLVKLVVYACHMDSLSFKSTKALPEDRAWCREVMSHYGMNEQEVVTFGYGVTNRNQDYHDYLMTGLKTYALGDKKIKSSYAVVVDDSDDLHKAAEMLRQELSDEVIAWCYLIQNAAADTTHVLLVGKNYYTIQSANRVLSRGKDVIPKVMEYLTK